MGNNGRLEQAQFERSHPITIFFNLGRVFYLIIIPVLRGFISALRGGFTRWLSGAWADILVFLLMLSFATAIWYFLRFRCDDKQIEVRMGTLNRRHTFIPWSEVTTISVVDFFYLRPLRALRFRVDTLGGSFKDSDFSILLTPKQANEILSGRRLLSDESLGKVYQPSTKSIIALSLLTSNSFGGILFISTLISQSGKIVGGEFSQMIIGTFEEATRRLAFGIPPAAVAIAYLLVAGWFIGFLLTLTRYKNFTLTRGKYTLSINGGIFTHREYHIKYSEINFIDIRQSIVSKLLKLNSLYISAVGYGKQNDDISCIIPTEREGSFDENRRKIFPALSPSPRELYPELRGIPRFLGEAITALVSITAAMLILLKLFPSWGEFTLFVGLMAYVPALFFLVVRIIDFRTCGLSFQDNNYTIRYSSGLSLHTMVIPKDKVVCIELRQGFLQKFGKYCDVVISSRAEGRSLHRCRNLVKSDVLKLIQI